MLVVAETEVSHTVKYHIRHFFFLRCFLACKEKPAMGHDGPPAPSDGCYGMIGQRPLGGEGLSGSQLDRHVFFSGDRPFLFSMSPKLNFLKASI